MEAFAVISGIVAAMLSGRFLFRVMFEDASEFWECVRYAFTPDLFSLFRGRFFEDMAKSFKLSLFLFATGGAGVLTFSGVNELIRPKLEGSFQMEERGHLELPAEKPE